MRAVGVIAEFNPFHDGHRYLLDRALDETGADLAVAVMSGPFTQRGSYALPDKWSRAADAVNAGFGLVLEIPPSRACASAQIFAEGGVMILEKLGGVEWIAFGSETGNTERLLEASFFLESHREDIRRYIRDFTRDGMNYPSARERAVLKIDPGFDTGLLSGPNDILALEYISRLKNMKPLAVKRSGAGHLESSTEFRNKIRAADPGDWMLSEKRYFALVQKSVLSMSDYELDALPGSAAGLGRKLKKEIRRASGLDELVSLVKSKAFTSTRVRRLLACAVLGIRADEAGLTQPLAKILALNGKGAAFLRENQKTGRGSLPVISNLSKEAEDHPELSRTLGRYISAQDLWCIIRGKSLYDMSDLVKSPVYKD